MENSIYVINPYKHSGMWVFDDDRVGLVKEPFVSGIPEIIEEAVKEFNKPERGFKLIFSSNPFPGYSLKLEKTGDEYGGTWYKCEAFGKSGWLCPALFKYFKDAPETIYAGISKNEN
jgi:hypothetical protein